MITNFFSVFSIEDGRTPRSLSEPLSVAWESPSNIAIVKYWGKRAGQLPANASLSMTLSRAFTTTSVKVWQSPGKTELQSVNGDPQHPFIQKLAPFFQWLIQQMPVLQGHSYSITTENSFPHSTGIASSASGISAFTLCMVDLAGQLAGIELVEEKFRSLVSYASRMGSGSACRSVYGGFSVWGEGLTIPGYSNFFATPVNDSVHPDLAHLHDAILVVSSKPKPIASSAGHNMMNLHPFAPARYIQAEEHLAQVLSALKSGDFELLGAIAENEALTLHALLMTSPAGDLLFEPATIAILKMVRHARSSGLPLFFTLDAGPNVHLLYPAGAATGVRSFISNKLLPFCEEARVIFDQRGEGPIKITPNHPSDNLESSRRI